MNLALRLVLSFLLVALFATAVNAVLSYRATQGNVQRFFDDERVWQNPNRLPGRRPPPPEQRLLLERLQRSQLEAGLWALGAALLVGGYLAYRLVQPIRQLTQVTRQYAKGERFRRATPQGSDEMAELSQAFNQLVDQLSAEEEQQKRMVADVAHELRTPLTILRGELEAVRYGLMEANPQNIDRLIEQVELLSRLVHDLRLLSLADAGALSLNCAACELLGLAQEALQAFTSRAEAQGVALHLQGQAAEVWADRERIKQVVYNLLDNALRHTPQGGVVRLEIRPQEDRVLLEVRDSGTGVDLADIPQLFDRFFRADYARNREGGGSGLGLAIVKTLVEAHGGTVGVANHPEGGARFWFALPKYQPNQK